MERELSITNPWATLDELWGIEVADDPSGDRPADLAAYGRCSTEDNQDPATSRGWQFGNASKFVGPYGGRIVEEYFDIGQSRSVPWERRAQASRLLAALKDPQRGWSGVVVGEGTRCWFGNQFSLVAPRFAAYGVELWVPELGGKYDPRNASHKMLMSVLGGMSESERQHVQARVRAAMDAQVVNDGRHQGGRAPFGYLVVDAGPHPNPRKSAEGGRLRVLTIEEATAEIVRQIFAMYLDGNGDRSIANQLNRDGVSCPSARRPEQNRHRQADGWQGSTVRAILDNPRYTGYAVFGRWVRHEMLLDPDDVAAGHVTRFRRAPAERIVRSREPAHPAIVSVQAFTQVQLARRSKAASGLAGVRRTDRGGRSTARSYLLRGLVRCGVCRRRMQGATIRDGAYYRCTARTMAPGAMALADHPVTVNLREDVVVAALNGWIGRLFEPEAIDRTVAELLGSQPAHVTSVPGMDDATARRTDAERRLQRFQGAIAAGVDPSALIEPMNQAQADRAAAQASIEATRASRPMLDDKRLRTMIASLGDLATTLTEAKPPALGRLYTTLGIAISFDPIERVAHVTAQPRVDSECVRGGT